MADPKLALLYLIELFRRLPAPEGPATPSVNRAHIVVQRWFARTKLGRAPITTDFVSLSWEIEGRHFVGCYAPASNGLNVWMRVAPGTAETIEIDGDQYLPADTFRQIEQALDLEEAAIVSRKYPFFRFKRKSSDT